MTFRSQAGATAPRWRQISCMAGHIRYPYIHAFALRSYGLTRPFVRPDRAFPPSPDPGGDSSTQEADLQHVPLIGDGWAATPAWY
jgi:hypothetical protein